MSELLDFDDASWVIRRWIRDKYGSQKAAAKSLGVSSPYLSSMINGKKNISQELLNAAGLERVTRYRSVQSK